MLSDELNFLFRLWILVPGIINMWIQPDPEGIAHIFMYFAALIGF